MCILCSVWLYFFFFCNDAEATEIYTYLHTLSRHDALPILAEIIERLATGNISVEVYGPDNHVANKPWLVSLLNADTDNADEYEGDTLAAALIAALATGEQS